MQRLISANHEVGSELTVGVAECSRSLCRRGVIWLSLAVFCGLPVTAGFASAISWGVATTISGDADVSTAGALAYAYTGGDSGATVNGVAFAAGNSGAAWGGDVDFSGFSGASSAYSGGTSVPWANLSSAYQTVLQGGAYGSATTATVTLKGLTAGHAYSVQIWVNDARGTGLGRSATATGANQATLDYNSTDAQGGVGQYVIGTFAADGTTQTFTLTSSSSVQLNALNLRDNGLGAYTPTRVNLARYQPVVVDSVSGTQSGSYLTDGLATDTSGWQSGNTGSHWAEVDFPFPVTVGSAQLVMGLDNVAPPTAFSLQYQTNGAWVNVPGATVAGNANKERNLVFSSPVTARALRFYDSADATVRLRELALYPPNGAGGFPFGTDFSIDLARKQPALATANTFGGWPLLATDGLVSPSSAWKSTQVGSNSLLVNLQFTNKIGSAHLYSGMTGVPPLSNFVLQYWSGGAWQNIPGGSVSGNDSSALVIPFTTPVTTTKVQLVFTNSGTSAVQELCIFPANNSEGYPLGTGVISNTPVMARYDTYSDSYYYLSNVAAGQVVVESNGAPVLGSPGGTNWTSQYQVLLNYDTGTYRLRNRASGLFLSGAQMTTNAGAVLADEDYSALPDQDWYVQSMGTGFQLVNQFSGLAVETQGGALVQNSVSNAASQRWQIAFAQVFPKKGIAGSGSGNPIKFAASWTYGWWYTGDPNLPGVNWFPMDSDSWYRGSTVGGNLWGLQSGWRRADYSLNVLSFNEPDHVDQANIDPTNAAIYYLSDQNLDLPLVGPAAANINGTWNSTFFGYITNWGCRMDYLPGHEYGSPSGGSSSCWINPLQTAYNTYGIPIWMTEFGIVDWGGTGGWSEEDNYTALAEFMWRTESVPWLRKYSLFLFTADTSHPMAPNPWTKTTPAPRSNTYDSHGNLTPFGELYAAWDDDAKVEIDKSYFIYNSGTRKRLQNTLGSRANATDIRVGDLSTQWTLQPAPGSGLYYVVSARDNRRLSYTSGGSVSLVASSSTGTAVQWSLTAYQYGWFYLDHPGTGLRLQLAFNNSTDMATFTMVANTTTSTAVQWRFIVPLPASSAWLGYNNNSWTTPGNWSSQETPPAGESVTFNSLSTSNLATTLNADFSLFGLSVTTPAGAVSIGGTNTLTLSSGGLDLSGATRDLTIAAPLVLSVGQSWNVATGRTLSVSGGVSDNGSGANLTVGGGGKVSLGAAAIYAGDTTVTADGTLQMGAANVLPSGAGAGNFIVNGALDLNGKAESINGLSGSGTVDNTGGGVSSLTVGYNDASGAANIFSGTIRDTLALVKTGAGALTLSSSNCYSGGTTLNSGSLYPKNNASFGTGSVIANRGTVYPTGGTYVFTNALTLNGGKLELGGGSGRTLNWSGPVSVTANSALHADGSTSGFTVSGGLDMGSGGYTLTSAADGGATAPAISGPISGVSGTVQVTGGTLILSGSNTFGGTVRAGLGTLSIANVYAVQNATLDYNAADSGSFNFNGLSLLIGGITGSRNQSLSANVAIGNNNVSTSYSGVLSGSGSVTKIGGGTLTLSGTNTYVGSTSINGGTLALSGGAAVASAVITVAGGARFDVSGMSSTFVLGGARTLTNRSAGAVLSGSSDCTIGTLSMVFDGLNPALVQTNGTLALSSSTVIRINNTGAPLGNGSYTIIVAAPAGNPGRVTGTLPPVVVTGNGALGTARLQINGGGGLDLVVTGVMGPQPTITSATVSGGNLILQGTNGVPSGAYAILTSTNVALPLSNWTTNATGTFTTGGLFSNAIPVTTESKQFFLIKQP